MSFFMFGFNCLNAALYLSRDAACSSVFVPVSDNESSSPCWGS